MPTKRDLARRVATLEEALETIHGVLDEALEIDDGEEEDEPSDPTEG